MHLFDKNLSNFFPNSHNKTFKQILCFPIRARKSFRIYECLRGFRKMKKLLVENCECYLHMDVDSARMIETFGNTKLDIEKYYL